MSDAQSKQWLEERNQAAGRQVGGDHYTKLVIQPWDAMQAWLSPDEFRGFLKGNVIKYMARANHKGQVAEDIAKAKHYMDKLAELERRAK